MRPFCCCYEYVRVINFEINFSTQFFADFSVQIFKIFFFLSCIFTILSFLRTTLRALVLSLAHIDTHKHIIVCLVTTAYFRALCKLVAVCRLSFAILHLPTHFLCITVCLSVCMCANVATRVTAVVVAIVVLLFAVIVRAPNASSAL